MTFKTLLLSVIAVFMCSNVDAALITTQAALTSPTVIDFSQFDIGSYTFTNGPTEIGALVGESVTWTAVGPSPGFGGGSYGLVSNGTWQDPLGPTGRNGYSFIDNSGSSMTYVFNAGPVQGVGGFMNYCPSCPVGPATIEALGVGNVVLESYNLEALAPIITPGETDAGAFRGILRPTSDIVAFRVLNRIAVLDDLAFSRTNVTAIPEPATLTLLGLGLSVAAARMRRQRK